MAKLSDRQQLLKDLKRKITAKLLARYLYGEDILEGLDEMPELIVYATIWKHRYLIPRTSVPRAPERLIWLLNELDDDRFRQELRMNKDSFLAIHDLIKGHTIYQCDPRRPQTDTKVQMMVALESLGMDGTGASVGRIARRVVFANDTKK